MPALRQLNRRAAFRGHEPDIAGVAVRFHVGRGHRVSHPFAIRRYGNVAEPPHLHQVFEGHRPAQRAALGTRAHWAKRLRTERRVHLRSVSTREPLGSALWHERHGNHHRDNRLRDSSNCSY